VHYNEIYLRLARRREKDILNFMKKLEKVKWSEVKSSATHRSQ